MKLLVKKNTLIGIVLFLSFLISYLYYESVRYKLDIGRVDDITLRKEGKIIVDATIVDLESDKNYLFGLKMPSERLECNNGAYYKIRLYNERIYFIVEKKSSKVSYFKDKNLFESKLSELDIGREKKLYYKKFDKLWERLRRSNQEIFDGCKAYKRE